MRQIPITLVVVFFLSINMTHIAECAQILSRLKCCLCRKYDGMQAGADSVGGIRGCTRGQITTCFVHPEFDFTRLAPAFCDTISKRNWKVSDCFYGLVPGCVTQIKIGGVNKFSSLHLACFWGGVRLKKLRFQILGELTHPKRNEGRQKESQVFLSTRSLYR